MALTESDLKSVFVDRTGILTADEFDLITKTARDLRRPTMQVLIERGVVSPRYFLELLGDFFGVPSCELKISDIDTEALNAVSETFATEHLLIPFAQEEKTLKIAMVDPRDLEVTKLLERMTRFRIQPYVATERAVRRALVLYRGSIRDALNDLLQQIAKGVPTSGQESIAYETPSVVSLLDALIDSALLLEASDIHLEPFETEVIVRLRVDGQLRSVANIPNIFFTGLIARLKVLANLRIDEHRLPQDGRFSTRVKGQAVDIRLSIVPSLWGEKAVMRVLPKEANLFDLASLGLLEWDLGRIKQHLQRPFGMVLVCGPTGSGKTTTLYAFLQEIGTEKIDIVNISTVEDPIEYTVPRVTQIQIHPNINLTFAVGLRSLLRQDPDIIMVGEIRDNETAGIAARAALIGRLVLSSLHTNNAIGAIPRLLDMGTEPYLISSTLTLVVAQRLVRKLCLSCRESYEPREETFDRIKEFCNLDYASEVLKKSGVLTESQDALRHIRLFRSKGCAKCDHTGYQGRIGVFEILEVSDALRSAITKQRDTVELKEVAQHENMKTIFLDGLAKAIMGVTDLEEVMRVTV